MIADPALRFWLDAVHYEGGLFEISEEDGAARALLPDHLQAELSLPALVAVTADPDVADEQPEALFLVPGHPALERMAQRILLRGDVGRIHLPWPPGSPPRAQLLLERSRATIDVEHGRIDSAGDPVRAYRPLLRLGVLVTYTLDEHFEEREEVWADAHAGVALDTTLSRRLHAQPRSHAKPESVAREQPAALPEALGAAHAALLQRIEARSAVLARQSQLALRGELARSENYYSEALAALEHRRVTATPERRALLEKQMQTLQEERARRHQEIEAKFEVSHRLQPYRAHLLHVPAFLLPVAIRRGERSYPFELCWLPALSAFLPPRCPSCGRHARLVAGRTRLACTDCGAA